MAFRPAVRGGGVYSPANRVVPGARPAPAPVARPNPIAQRRTDQVQRVQQQLGLPRLTQPAPVAPPAPVATPPKQLALPGAPQIGIPEQPRPTPGQLNGLPPQDLRMESPMERPAPDQLNGLPPGVFMTTPVDFPPQMGFGIPGVLDPGQLPGAPQIGIPEQYPSRSNMMNMLPPQDQTLANMGGFNPADLYNQYSSAMPQPIFAQPGMTFGAQPVAPAQPQTPSVFNATTPTVGT